MKVKKILVSMLLVLLASSSAYADTKSIHMGWLSRTVSQKPVVHNGAHPGTEMHRLATAAKPHAKTALNIAAGNHFDIQSRARTEAMNVRPIFERDGMLSSSPYAATLKDGLMAHILHSATITPATAQSAKKVGDVGVTFAFTDSWDARQKTGVATFCAVSPKGEVKTIKTHIPSRKLAKEISHQDGTTQVVLRDAAVHMPGHSGVGNAHGASSKPTTIVEVKEQRTWSPSAEDRKVGVRGKLETLTHYFEVPGMAPSANAIGSMRWIGTFAATSSDGNYQESLHLP